MCRLYGFHANEPTKVECALVLAQNSLLTQSRGVGDRAEHADGWGIAYYENAQPTVERRETAAFEDAHFSETAERVFARTVVAHVRQATVGGRLLANTHPYVFGGWSFAHNGTVAGFARLEERLGEETDPELRELRRGTNDSEVVFLWLMTRLRRQGIEPLTNGDDSGDRESTEVLAEALRTAIQTLIERGEEVAPNHVSRLNFLLTDGRRLVASRWNRDLHLVERVGVHDCEICGIPHIEHDDSREYRAVVLASEPLTHEEWRQVPQGSLVSVAADLETRVEPLG